MHERDFLTKLFILPIKMGIESYRPVYPGTEFTHSMTPAEAEIRGWAADVVNGVSFEIRDPKDPVLEKYSLVLAGYVIGTTTVFSDEALLEYSKLAERRLFELRDKIDRQREAYRKHLL